MVKYLYLQHLIHQRIKAIRYAEHIESKILLKEYKNKLKPDRLQMGQKEDINLITVALGKSSMRRLCNTQNITKIPSSQYGEL